MVNRSQSLEQRLISGLISIRVISVIVVLALVVLSLALLANSMTKRLAHDEQMYCGAGILLAQGKMIYRDFSYPSQMPYHPLLCAALFRIFNTTHFLLVARLFSAFCDILVAMCIFGIYRRIFATFPLSGMLLGLGAVVLYVFNPHVDYANGFAWNNDVVILCVVLSFWLFISIDFKKKSKYWRIAAIAALLTLATCMRITVALVQLLFFAVLLTQPAGSIKQKFKTILPFLIATAIVLIWPVWTAALAPRAFFLNLFHISILNSEWVHQTGMFHRKLDIILLFLTTRGSFILILIMIYLCATIAWKRRKLTISNTENLLLAVLLALVFFIIALIMPTLWKQHLAMPIPFIVISFAFPLLYLRKLNSDTDPNKHFKIARCLIIACAVVAVASRPIVLRRIPRLFRPQDWVPIRLHRISEDIAAKTAEPKLILTL
ncbi:MAG: glycosyltransferase family 39 protein, partial [Planctomycetota bacterium]